MLIKTVLGVLSQCKGAGIDWEAMWRGARWGGGVIVDFPAPARLPADCSLQGDAHRQHTGYRTTQPSPANPRTRRNDKLLL